MEECIDRVIERERESEMERDVVTTTLPVERGDDTGNVQQEVERL